MLTLFLAPNLIHILVVLVILGAAVYLVNTVLPIDPRFKTIINVVLIVFALIWLLRALGVGTGF